MDDIQAFSAGKSVDNWQVWREEIRGIGVTNPLVNFEPNTFGQIDLERAHPGGLAQFVSGGTTVLSNLVRDPLAYSRAAAAARRIRLKAEQLDSHFGVQSIFLVGGLADFEGDGFDLTHPILLWPASINPKGEDFEISLDGSAVVNPALIESLDTCYGIKLNQSELLRRLDEHTDLVPIAILQYLSELTASKARLDFKRILVLSNFTTVPTELLADFDRIDVARDSNPVIKRLSDENAHYEPVVIAPVREDLLLVADADYNQRKIVSRALGGHSFAVETLPGCGYTQTVVNTLGALVAAGKRVLVVAPRRQTLNEIADRLSGFGLAGLGVRSTHTWLDLIAAISRFEKAQPADFSGARASLKQVSAQLADYFDALSRPDEELGVSTSQVLEELARLSAMPHAPVTSARIPRDKLAGLRDRTEALRLLTEAHALGEFDFGPQDTAWYQAVFESPDDVEHSVGLARRLRDEVFPKLKQQLADFIAAANFRPAESVADWGIYLRLFNGIRDTLDRFVPDVFDRPLDELIQATAARKEKGAMSGGTRRRLKKLAKEYLRPGMSVSDMSSALQAIDEQRQMWQRLCQVPTPPRVQSGINDALISYQGFMSDIEAIQRHLDPESEDRPLAALSLDELELKLKSLSQDTDALKNLGERAMVARELREHGLGKVARDLGRLHTSKEHLAIELDLAWWQSALEVISGRDSLLLKLSSNQLNALEAQFANADQAVEEASTRALNFDLAERWKLAIAQFPAEADGLRNQLKTGRADLRFLAAVAPHLLPSLAPAVLMSPYEVPANFAPNAVFDTVLILDAAGSTVAENFAALRRSRQVIAFGDDAIALPVGFETEARASALGRELPVNSIYRDVRDHFDAEALKRSYRTSGQTLGDLVNREFYQNRIIFEPTAAEFFGKHNYQLEVINEGNRASSTIEGANESLDAEVERVLDLVINHALWHPDESLLVVSASVMHADRIRSAVAAKAKSNTDLERFFETHGREKFEVSTLAELTHRIADRVIFSIGFGRTPHGAVLSRFGQLSEPDGRRALANLLVSARHAIIVVSCFEAADVPTDKLTGGAVYLKDLLDPLNSKNFDGTNLEQDPMLRDLTVRLQKLGVRVVANYGDRLPLVAAYGNSAAVIAPDWDLRGLDLNEKLRLRPQLLRALGWRYIRVHSFELFADPQNIAHQIAEQLGLSISKRPQALFENDDKAFEDTDLAWGDRADSNDRRLRDDKPPHWG